MPRSSSNATAFVCAKFESASVTPRKLIPAELADTQGITDEMNKVHNITLKHLDFIGFNIC